MKSAPAHLYGTGCPNRGSRLSLTIGAPAWTTPSGSKRPARFDDWHLFVSRTPVTNAARALILGQIYRSDGAAVASVAQEGLVRVSNAPRGQR